MSHRKNTSIELLQPNRNTENLFYVDWISAKNEMIERLPGYLAVAVTLQILRADTILISGVHYQQTRSSLAWDTKDRFRMLAMMLCDMLSTSRAS